MTAQTDCPDFFTDGYCDMCIYADECRAEYEDRNEIIRIVPIDGQSSLERW